MIKSYVKWGPFRHTSHFPLCISPFGSGTCQLQQRRPEWMSLLPSAAATPGSLSPSSCHYPCAERRCTTSCGPRDSLKGHQNPQEGLRACDLGPGKAGPAGWLDVTARVTAPTPFCTASLQGKPFPAAPSLLTNPLPIPQGQIEQFLLNPRQAVAETMTAGLAGKMRAEYQEKGTSLTPPGTSLPRQELLLSTWAALFLPWGT